MRLSRALIVTLALMVSPAAAAVCEVVCGTAPHAAHQADAAPVPEPAPSVDLHAHHGHHQAPASETVIVRAASPDDIALSVPAPDCDLRGAAPARVRLTSTDAIASAAAIATSVYRRDHALARHTLFVGGTSSPPAPPPLTPLPLRI